MPDLRGTTNPGRGSDLLSRRQDLHPEATSQQTATFCVEPPRPVPEPAGEPVLLFERVSKWYGPVIGVNQVTLELRPGITGLVGANGAGKSTLMRLATGLARADLGRVPIRGQDARSLAARRQVGYCPEIDTFYEEMSGRQFVQSMARLCGYTRAEARWRTEAVLERVNLVAQAHRIVRGYSKGMRQRIKLAQALLHDPDLLVLDEPFSGIDPVGRQEMIALFLELAAQGKCLLISSHELEELEKLTDHVAIMARGRIAAVGCVAEIRERLQDHPFSIRIELSLDYPQAVRSLTPAVTFEEAGAPPPESPAMFHEEHATVKDGKVGPTLRRDRELAARLLTLPQVVAVELLEEDPTLPEGVGGVIVRARQPVPFFQALGRLVLEEWYDVRRMETLDETTSAVLGYLLGGSVAGLTRS